MKRNFLSILVLAFSSAILAQAFLPAFEDVDANGDGEISREEASAIEVFDFDMADTNQDGHLDRNEYEALRSR